MQSAGIYCRLDHSSSIKTMLCPQICYRKPPAIMVRWCPDPLLLYVGSSQYQWKKMINNFSFNFGITGQQYMLPFIFKFAELVKWNPCRLSQIYVMLLELASRRNCDFLFTPEAQPPSTLFAHFGPMNSGQAWGLWPLKIALVDVSPSTCFWSDPWTFPAGWTVGHLPGNQLITSQCHLGLEW